MRRTRRPRWRRGTSGFASLAILACLVGNAPAASAAGEGEPAATKDPYDLSLNVAGSVALAGRVEEATSLQDAYFKIWVQPNQNIRKNIEKGAEVQRLLLPDSAVTAEGDKFAVTVDPKHLSDKYISINGLVSLEIEVYLPGVDKASWTTASVRLRNKKGDTKTRWADAKQTSAHAAEQRSIPAAGPAEVTMDLRNLPKQVQSLANAENGSTPTGEFSALSAMKIAVEEKPAWATIGKGYPTRDGSSWMTFSQGSEASYGAASSYSGTQGSFEASGSTSISSSTNFSWDEHHEDREYRVGLKYTRYRHLNKDGIELYQTWEASGHTGGSEARLIHEHPDWLVKTGGDLKCAPVDTGTWDRSKSDQKAFSLGAGVSFASLGFGLSVERQYSESSALFYKTTPTANYLCGNDGTPAEASQVAQYATGKIEDVQHRQCPANFEWPEAKEVKTKEPPTETFLNYAENTAHGWTGGDSTYSVKMPDGRRLWLFSDTFLGPINDDGTRPVSAPFVRQSFVIQDGSSLSTVTAGTPTAPQTIMVPPEVNRNHDQDKRWYWLGDGFIADVDGEKRLQVIYHEWHKFGDGGWDFRLENMVVATFALDDLTSPIDVNPIPSDADVQWGAAILPAAESGDGYTYVYGIDDAPYNKEMRIARVPGSDISDTSKWQFLDQLNNAWMRGESEGTNVLTGVANEFSVTPWRGAFVLISQDSTEAFSNRIRMWFSCAPADPFGYWSGHDEVYRMPETGPWGSYGDPDIFAYNAHVHNSMTSGDRHTLSYNVNSFDSTVGPEGAHYRDPSIYKPRFISFRIVPGTGASASEFTTQKPGSSAASQGGANQQDPRCTVCMGVPR